MCGWIISALAIQSQNTSATNVPFYGSLFISLYANPPPGVEIAIYDGAVDVSAETNATKLANVTAVAASVSVLSAQSYATITLRVFDPSAAQVRSILTDVALSFDTVWYSERAQLSLFMMHF
jgi:hypothetical protein